MRPGGWKSYSPFFHNRARLSTERPGTGLADWCGSGALAAINPVVDRTVGRAQDVPDRASE